jgi:hypothetical protein
LRLVKGLSDRVSVNLHIWLADLLEKIATSDHIRNETFLRYLYRVEGYEQHTIVVISQQKECEILKDTNSPQKTLLNIQWKRIRLFFKVHND